MKTLFQLLKERRSIQSTIDNVLERFCLEATTGLADGVCVPLFENHAPKELKDQRDDFFSDFRLVDAIIFSTKQLDYPVSEQECNELALFLEFTPQDTAKFINQCASTQEQMNDYLSFHENEMRDYL